MPGFDDYVKDIKALQKGPGSIANHEQWRDLVRWYGDALREYTEKQAFPPKAKWPAKLDKEKSKLDKLTSPWPGVGVAVGGTVDADYLKAEAQQFLDEAARQRKRGDDDHKAGHGDQASEAYVDAAVSTFRAALAYCALGGPGPLDYAKQEIREAALNYGIRLTEAAKDLAEAAANEDAGDTSEVAAEALVGQVFAAVAAATIEDLVAGIKAKGLTLDAASKTALDNAKKAAQTALAAADAKMKGIEKK